MMPRNSFPIIERKILCTHQIKLEQVLGVTVSSNAALDSAPLPKIVAYPAGCTVVLFNVQTGLQNHIINTCRKSVTSLAFSSCGKYLVTGECGHQPAVRVWDLDCESQIAGQPQIQQVAEFLSHKHGINCVAFSASNKYVVSVGSQHDMIVNVWQWKKNIKVASNKVSTNVKALAFSENGKYFVTAGNRHVKFWFLECGKTKNKEAVPLMGRSAILGELRNNYFCDVACGKGLQCGDSTYAITRSGLLCEFNSRRLLNKWVELRTTSANCIAVGEKHIIVGCAEGIVRCFDSVDLNFITTLPRPHYLGVDVSQGLNIRHMSTVPNDVKFPDTVAVTYDEINNKLTCIYNDHSIYVWDVHNINRVGKSQSSLYHSACIWGVETAPPHSNLPAGSFLTCSSDDTIRVWNLDKPDDKSANGIYRSNIYSDELLKVVYVDEELTYLRDLNLSATNVGGEKSSYDGRNGVRCIRLSPDGQHLASGDRTGNIRVHETKTMKRLIQIEAHDAEVLCLEYSNVESASGAKVMASASRDRLIHVFDVTGGYNFLQTLDDHSSSITAVRLLNTSHGSLQMVSCGADKSLIFRSLGGSANGSPQFVRSHNVTGKTTLYDMEVDAGQKHIVTACQDRNVRIYNVNTGKHTKSFKGSTGDDGTLIKVVLDRSGIYLATSCTDKSLSVYDYYTGECMATMCGHSELATGLRFTNDCRRLISASGDGCIFVWRVPHDMVVTMHARLSQQALRQGKTLDIEVLGDDSNPEVFDPNSSHIVNGYRFSVRQLPLWAKKHISEDAGPSTSHGGKAAVAAPKGRWAQRAELANASSFTSLQTTAEDSSLESEIDGRRNKVVLSDKITLHRGSSHKQSDDVGLGALRVSDNDFAAHDGDIDSDHEYRLLYYPTQVDSASGSEYTVNNIDVDELRRSVRKSKRANLPAITIQTTSVSGSQDSDDDDDEASTPSGENTDRNPLSMLSISSESIDQLENREKYLQSTFESLSADVDTPVNKGSISSQFHTRSGATTTLRNMAVINATKQTKNDPDAVRKREQLNKMIADTRKKLANVGYNSPLKYSNSTQDLSHIPERDRWGSTSRKPGGDSTDIGLRRACSLSALSLQAPVRKPEPVAGKLAKSTSVTTRPNSRYAKSNSMTRSRSTGGLNQSDSDTESNEKKTQSRLMRPTISSLNKLANVKGGNMRKRHHSVMNLSFVGQEDSSSEDVEPVTKPTVPPRTRSQNPDVSRKVTNKEKPKAAARQSASYERENEDSSNLDDTLQPYQVEELDVTSLQLSTQLCDEVALQLTRSSNNVIELYRRLTSSTDADTREQATNMQQTDMVKNLELSMEKTVKSIQDALTQFKLNNGNIDVNQTDTVKKLNDLVSKRFANDQSNVVNMMEKYSDILLGLMQQKMQNTDT